MTGKEDVIKRWIQKAEIDIKTARILIKSEDPPTESICFHAQQAVEKFLKAYLTHMDVRAGKTHDIATLLEMCIEKDKEFENMDIEKLENLTYYAVNVRYPETFYTQHIRERGYFNARSIRISRSRPNLSK
ncbi:MAG: HEPN domain-containing protein [Candidatus Freyarchaeota archaeon]